MPKKDWKKYKASVKATQTDPKAQLRLLFSGKGTIDIDMVSLFPSDTWKGRPGGLRKDLVQMIADLKPGFIRFPGGCIVEGRDLTNRYQWKTTVGPVEERKLIMNRRMYEVLNMRILFMNGSNHDVHAAYISHISHISSFALALTVLEKEKNEKHIFDLASGGFDSTVRLAKSSPEMWAPIFSQNKENILTVLDTYISKLKTFRKHIENEDTEHIYELINDSNRIKRVIK